MWWLLSVLLLGLAEARNRLDPLVDTKIGLIRGLRASDGDYSMFLGIPYAKVNESNPFGPSLPQPNFEETFEAFDDSAICPQVEELSNTIKGSLDCLHLNIYVPNTATTKNPLPVLVWIYGGGFQIGYAGRFLYGPRFLVRHDVILVTLNYRLGPYGFMCLDTPDVPGNQGLKDQLSALRWVKDNINAFGGDVNKITIFGESAGAVSVDLHLMSEQENLFSKVIMQSGAALSPWAIIESDSSTPLQMSKHLGLDTEDVDQALSFLAGISPELIIGATKELSLTFGPCVEKDFEGVEKFVADYPINTEIPKAKSIPILTGYNDDEQLLQYVNKESEAYENEENVFKTSLASAYNFGDDLDEMADFVRHFYIGDEKVSEFVKWQLIDFSSDFYFNHPVHRSVQKYLNNDAAAVYHYVFSYVGERNLLKKRYNVHAGGAAHADEIAYLFDISYDVNITPDDQVTIDRMTTLWTNFAKYGDPTPVTTDLLPEKWLPVTKDSLNYLNINFYLSMGTRPFHSRSTFWDLFVKMNKQSLKGYKDEI
ncbi:bile salt-activated lipase-like [Epargyreus clarus]|uniref:bile salt-activated lipase-like n=1 Tax=Epargyreus clarus TaxID=520877 RepID=UPI003C30E54B